MKTTYSRLLHLAFLLLVLIVSAGCTRKAPIITRTEVQQNQKSDVVRDDGSWTTETHKKTQVSEDYQDK